ncbi:ATP-binding cassette, subfamily B, bacterial IrtB/YbtQ, partial [Enteropsectra breve]
LLLPLAFVLALFVFNFISEGDTGLLPVTLLYGTLSSQLNRLGNDLSNLMMYLDQLRYAKIEENNKHTGTQDIAAFNSTIEFKDTTLWHGDSAIISGISAVIRKGEKIAIVGPNGTGKSTFIRSLMGFTKTTGEILYDGVDQKMIEYCSMIKLISYVSQNDYTADDTVLNNLLLGHKDATRETVIEKARHFGAHEAFTKLQDGYKTKAGPRGSALSGGQRQRISIVRATVKDAPIFLMDEATASMDKKTEAKLIELLFGNLHHKTLLMIVHGTTYLKKFDRIFFFKNKTLHAAGPYNELIETTPAFAEYIKAKH